MPDYIIEHPLSREVLALYHADALSEIHKNQVEALLTSDDQLYLEELDNLKRTLTTYGSHEFFAPEEIFTQIMYALPEQTPLISPEQPIKPLIKYPKRHKTLRSILATVSAVIAFFGIFSLSHIFLFKRHLPFHMAKPHSAISIVPQTPLFDESHRPRNISLQSQALTCVNHLKHSHYIFKEIISLHINYSQHLTYILLRQTQPDKALLLTVPYQCLLNPHKVYSFKEKTVNY